MNNQLRGFSTMFNSTDPQKIKHEIINIDIKNLIHYKNHPFKMYKGERFDNMVDSIKNNGIFTPIIVRPIKNDNFNYEILSGHNRVEASKNVGLKVVPCLIKEDLTDEEVHLIVTESNLIQRSFIDLSHSERASALATHYEAIKKQGKRNDLILEMENLLLGVDTEEYKKKSNADKNKAKSYSKIGEKYDLSNNTVARYVRINKLINEFKDLIDDDKLSIRSGVSLSYIKAEEQEDIYNYIIENEVKIDTKKAKELKQLSIEEKFTIENMTEIFMEEKKNKTSKVSKSVTIKGKDLKGYFTEDESKEEIKETIIKALELYFEYKDKIEKEIEEEL